MVAPNRTYPVLDRLCAMAYSPIVDSLSLSYCRTPAADVGPVRSRTADQQPPLRVTQRLRIYGAKMQPQSSLTRQRRGLRD